MLYTDPYLDEGMRGWIFNTARKNVGRIANYDLDDLVQEGYACFYKCKARYVGKRGLIGRDGGRCRYLSRTNPDKTARQHFQALVKTTFNNVITTLAVKQPCWEIPISNIARVDQDTTDAWESVLPPQDEVASATLLIQNAPWEIKQLFELLVNDALELTGYRREKLKHRRSLRETTNQYYCRLLGIPAERDYDIVGAVERYFLTPETKNTSN